MALFASQEWVQAYANALNTSEAYHEAARDWQGDFYFLISHPDTSLPPTIIYLALVEGKCSLASVVESMDQYKPEFEVKSTYDNWKKVITKEISPLQAMMSGRMAIKGNMMKLMKQSASAQELLNSLSQVETEFPE